MRHAIKQLLEEVITSEELAKMFKVQPVTIRQWIRRGKLDGVKKGRDWLFDRKDF